MLNTTLTPAYGRDYKSRAAVLADWDAGKDFVCNPSGQYASKDSFPKGTTITFRYKNKTMAFIHKVS